MSPPRTVVSDATSPEPLRSRRVVPRLSATAFLEYVVGSVLLLYGIAKVTISEPLPRDGG